MSAQDVLTKLEIINPNKIFCSKKHVKEFSKSKYKILNIEDYENKNFVRHLSSFSNQNFISIGTK